MPQDAVDAADIRSMLKWSTVQFYLVWTVTHTNRELNLLENNLNQWNKELYARNKTSDEYYLKIYYTKTKIEKSKTE